MVTHSAIHWLLPSFSPPWSGKADWIQISLKAELLSHIVFLGVFITSIRNMIPAIRRPFYGDDGLLGIASET